MPKKKIIKLDRKKGLYLKEAGHKGRGVFCTQNIRKGEVLEITPAIPLNEKSTKHVDRTILLNYTFVTGKIPARLRKQAGVRKTEDASSVVLGLLSFCNHDEHPNAEVSWDVHDGTLYYILTATRAIPKNTEICTTYGDDWFSDRT